MHFNFVQGMSRADHHYSMYENRLGVINYFWDYCEESAQYLTWNASKCLLARRPGPLLTQKSWSGKAKRGKRERKKKNNKEKDNIIERQNGREKEEWEDKSSTFNNDCNEIHPILFLINTVKYAHESSNCRSKGGIRVYNEKHSPMLTKNLEIVFSTVERNTY
jgi:hypothetical protein